MIKLLVDSSADFTAEELAQRGVLCVPLGVSIGGADYLDGVDLSRDRFYELLTTAPEFPRTTMPSLAAFAEHFEQAMAAGDSVICILVSSAMSGTYQAACTARDMVGGENIFVVDSLTAAAGTRIMADYALQLINEGVSAAEIAKKLESLRSRIHVFAAVDTLEYLYKGGRLSRAAAAVGTIASLKPVLTIDRTGAVSVIKKSISRTRARNDLLDIIRSRNIDPRFPVYTIYTDGTENVEYLEEQLSGEGIVPAGRTRIGPAIGSHVGPGVYGLFLVERES